MAQHALFMAYVNNKHLALPANLFIGLSIDAIKDCIHCIDVQADLSVH